MTKQEKEIYRHKKPIAVYCMSNWGGVEILDILYGIDDYVVARFNFGEPQEPHRVKIRYGVKTDTFRIGRTTIHLDECMRCN